MILVTRETIRQWFHAWLCYPGKSLTTRLSLDQTVVIHSKPKKYSLYNALDTGYITLKRMLKEYFRPPVNW